MLFVLFSFVSNVEANIKELTSDETMERLYLVGRWHSVEFLFKVEKLLHDIEQKGTPKPLIFHTKC